MSGVEVTAGPSTATWPRGTGTTGQAGVGVAADLVGAGAAAGMVAGTCSSMGRMGRQHGVLQDSSLLLPGILLQDSSFLHGDPLKEGLGRVTLKVRAEASNDPNCAFGGASVAWWGGGWGITLPFSHMSSRDHSGTSDQEKQLLLVTHCRTAPRLTQILPWIPSLSGHHITLHVFVHLCYSVLFCAVTVLQATHQGRTHHLAYPQAATPQHSRLMVRRLVSHTQLHPTWVLKQHLEQQGTFLGSL